MISISKFRQLAGKEAQGLTDEEIEQIIDAQCQFAELAFDTWVIKKGLKQKLNRDIDSK
ncbi:MAG: hypothetical protein KAI71_02555 [Candidatus Pacebacteria bacterium]|nr:hypothetical protein [Candidatus Paceibacterota bacterium]